MAACGALRAAGAELHHAAALGRADDAVGLGGDQALVIDGQQARRSRRAAPRWPGARTVTIGSFGEHGRPLRHGVNVAGEAEGAQIFQKFLAENALAAQVRNVLLVKVQILDVFDELLEARRDGKAAAVRDRAEINVKIGDAIFDSRFGNSRCPWSARRNRRAWSCSVFLPFSWNTSYKFGRGTLTTAL